jgi:Excalibur calcium-binding domain
MRLRAKAKGQLFAFAATVTALCLWIPSGSGAAPVPGCHSFDSQAGAQAYFMKMGGSPSRRVGRLDSDGDGVACESLKGPYQGYATIGYNKKGDFLYGVVTMPAGDSGTGEYPCLIGNAHFPDAPRRLNVYRVRSGNDRPLLPRRGRGAEAKAATGRLLWRADRKVVPRGRYYVEFEAEVRATPYGKNQCPGFRSRAVELP